MAGGVPRSGGESLLSHGFAVPAPPEGKPRALRTVLAPRIYEGGGPRSGRGSLSAAAGKASSVTASPCQLPQRGSRERFAPFLPPAFMRGEGHEVAGGVPPPQRGRPSQSRFACQLSQGESQGTVPRNDRISGSCCCYVTLRILPWGEFSGPVRLRERHFFVQFVENDEKYFFIPHFPIAFCAI